MAARAPVSASVSDGCDPVITRNKSVRIAALFFMVFCAMGMAISQEVLVFGGSDDWPFDSVRGYFLNLSSHRAYDDFRRLRVQLRASNEPLSPLALAGDAETADELRAEIERMRPPKSSRVSSAACGSIRLTQVRRSDA